MFFFRSCSCSFDDAPLSLSPIINSKKSWWFQFYRGFSTQGVFVPSLHQGKESMTILRCNLGQCEKCENFEMRLRRRWKKAWEFQDEILAKVKHVRILIRKLRWKQVWELGDATYIEVKQGLRIRRWDLCQGEKRHKIFEMWLKSKWNFEMQFRTLKCDLSQNEKKAWKSQKYQIMNYIILWVHIFFISSPIELEGNDVIMKRNNSNDASSFFLNWNCFFSWDMWASCMK